MSDRINIYKTGYQIDEEDSFVKIPDWSLPVTEEPPAPDAAASAGEEGEVAAEEDAAKPRKSKSKPKPAEPEVRRLTAEDIERENRQLLQQVAEEVAEQAYSDARRSMRRELQASIDDMHRKFAELEAKHDDYMVRYTESLKYMAIEIAQKIMLQKIEEDDVALAPLVTQTIASIKHTEWISVDISNRLQGLVAHMQAELEKPEYEGRVELRPGPHEVDTVRVSTDTGTIDAGIRTQIGNLRRAFENAEKT